MSALQFVIEFFRSRNSDDEGATAVEYALLIGIITIAVAAVAVLLAGKITTVFNSVISVI